jgi:hypothetical protein
MKRAVVTLVVGLALALVGAVALDPVAPLEAAAPAAPQPQVATEQAADPEPNRDLHPHPLTPERNRLQRELQLVAALNDAMDVHDVPAMRRLIALYMEHDPTDEHRMQAGYAAIADCLQYPGDPSRARAQRYYDTERASTLRRYVRRNCLER